MNQNEDYITYFAKIDKICRKCCCRSVAGYDFTPNEIMVMMFLFDHQEFNSASDIANHRNISKGLVAKSVLSLCEKGYLAAGKDKRDRRLVSLYLTEKSREVVARIKTCRQGFMDALLDGIGDEDLEVLNRVARVMNQNLENMQKVTEKSGKI